MCIFYVVVVAVVVVVVVAVDIVEDDAEDDDVDDDDVDDGVDDDDVDDDDVDDDDDDDDDNDDDNDDDDYSDARCITYTMTQGCPNEFRCKQNYKGSPKTGCRPDCKRAIRARYAPSANPQHGFKRPTPNRTAACLPHRLHQMTCPVLVNE